MKHINHHHFHFILNADLSYGTQRALKLFFVFLKAMIKEGSNCVCDIRHTESNSITLAMAKLKVTASIGLLESESKSQCVKERIICFIPASNPDS